MKLVFVERLDAYAYLGYPGSYPGLGTRVLPMVQIRGLAKLNWGKSRKGTQLTDKVTNWYTGFIVVIDGYTGFIDGYTILLGLGLLTRPAQDVNLPAGITAACYS